MSIKIVDLGMDDIPEEIRELAEALGAEIVGAKATVTTREPDPNCDCEPCRMRREFEAKYPGRSPLHHPKLNVVETEDGRELKDIVRHRLFKDNRGNTMFFNALLHPVDELNLYVCEMERMAMKDFQVEPVLNDDGSAKYVTVDFRHANMVELEHVRGMLTSADGRQVNVMAIAGPDFDAGRARRLSQAH